MNTTAGYKLVERTSLAPSMINVIPAGPVPAKAGSGERESTAADTPRRQERSSGLRMNHSEPATYGAFPGT